MLYNIKYNLIENKLGFMFPGIPYLEESANWIQKIIFNSIKEKIEFQKKYKTLHFRNFPPNLYNLKINTYIYNIPADIIPFICYNNKKIYIDNPISDELKEKAEICKVVLEIDINYMIHFLNVSCVGGERIGIKNNTRKRAPSIIFQVSYDDKIGLYETFSDIKNSKTITEIRKNVSYKMSNKRTY